jgi:hypothetical protein
MLFYRMKEALAYWESNTFCRVIGEDSNDKGAKRFHVVNPLEETELCFRGMSNSFSSCYELIHTEYVYLCFDIDATIKVVGSSGDEEDIVYEASHELLSRAIVQRCRSIRAEILRDGISEELLRALRLAAIELVRNGIFAVLGHHPSCPAKESALSGVLDATRMHGGKPKFSLHVHTQIAVMGHHTDAAAIALAINFWCVTSLWRTAMVPDANSVTLALFAIVWPWRNVPEYIDDVARAPFIDTSIYSRNRCMRMYAQTKLGESRPLREVDMSIGSLLPLQSTPAMAWKVWTERYRISVEEPGQGFFSVTYTAVPDFLALGASAMRALATRSGVMSLGGFSSGTIRGTCVISHSPLEDLRCSQSLGFLAERGLDLSMFRRAVRRKSGRIASSPNVEVPRFAVSGRTEFTILLATDTLYDDNGRTVIVEDVCPGDILHCPSCDVAATGPGDGPDLNPSMRAFQSFKSCDVLIYCFGCSTLNIIRNVVDYEGFKADATVIDATDGYVRWTDLFPPRPLVASSSFPISKSSSTSSSLYVTHRKRFLVAVNCPMGSGKTQAVSEYANKVLPPDTSFLIVTYRRALARQLAERFQAACYLDFRDSEIPFEDQKRIVICTNSLERLRRRGGEKFWRYSLLVIDEAGFVRRHYVQGTFCSSLDRTRSYRIMQEKILNAETTVIMQDALSTSDVLFYRTMGQFDVQDTRKVYMRRRPLAEVLKSTTDEDAWIVALQRTIRAGRLVFICCSTRRDAEVLYEAITDKVSDLFRSREYEPEDWSRRVALVTGLTTFPKDILRTVEDFTEHFRSFSVAIATSVLETGVSLSGHFTHVFGHFKRLPIPHAAQAQLSARVRNAECIFLLLERGQAGMFMDKVKQISAVLNIDLTSVEEALFNDTVADVMAEFADTYNRNDVLWQEIRHSHCVDEEEDGLEASGSFTAVRKGNCKEQRCEKTLKKKLGSSIAKKLARAGFMDSGRETCKEAEEDMKEIRQTVTAIRQTGNHSVRRYFLGGTTIHDISQPDLDRIAQEDIMALATASRNISGLRKWFGEKAVLLYLCLARTCVDAPRSRARKAELTCLTPKHLVRTGMQLFAYMALVDYRCSLREGVRDEQEVKEATYWPHMSSMGRSNTEAGRRLQFMLSKVRFGSRLAETMWGSIWPESCAAFVPTEGNLGRVLHFLEVDSTENIQLHEPGPGAEVKWAAAGRKRPETIAARIRKKPSGEKTGAITQLVREYTALQTFSARKQIQGMHYNAAHIKMHTVSTLGVVMAAFQPRVVGLHDTTTVGWAYFKDTVDAFRASVESFEPSDEALIAAQANTPHAVEHSIPGEEYTERHRELDRQSLEACGFYSACEKLRERFKCCASILAPPH